MSLDPVVYFFVLGFAARLLRSDLRLPPAIYEFVSTVLLLAIGLKGGRELAGQPLAGLVPGILSVLAMGVALTVLAFALLRLLARPLARVDAAAIAAHYGSVSVGTFAVALAYLTREAIPYEPEVSLYLVLLEIPALVVAVFLARGIQARVDWRALGREVLLGRSVLLLVGGLAIGFAAGPNGLEPVAPLFFGLFKGMLAIFLLEMGLIAADNVGGFRRHGPFLVAFAVAVPVLFASIGLGVAHALGLSLGGSIVLATLAGSASYIAAPAAMRSALPEANPALSLTAALAVTFPFNILVGIPLYQQMAEWLHA